MANKSEIYRSQECIIWQLLLWKAHNLAFMGLLLLLDTVAFGQSHVWKFSRIVCRISMYAIQKLLVLYLTQFFIWGNTASVSSRPFHIFLLVLWIITICRQVKENKVGITVQKLANLLFPQCKSFQTFFVTVKKLRNLFWVKIELWLD